MPLSIGGTRSREQQFQRRICGVSIADLPLCLILCIGLGWSLICGGCAPLPGSRHPEQGVRTGAVLIDRVGFYPQTMYQCGPAALATIFNYYDKHLRPEEIAQSIYRGNIRGTVTLDMVLYARQKGFAARWFNGSPDEIRKAVDLTQPLIVMVDLGFLKVSRLHYMVVLGYDAEHVIVNSGRQRHKKISWARFRSDWEKTRNWTLKIEPQP